jgi:hypothetical protein
MPASGIYMTRRRNPKKEKQTEFELRRLPRLIKSCAEDLPYEEYGKTIGKSYSTFASRLSKPGTLTLDELAVFISGGYCPEDAVVENVTAFLKAKAEILKNT